MKKVVVVGTGSMGHGIVQVLAMANCDVDLRLEAGLMGLMLSTEDVKEGREAFMSRRKAQFKGKWSGGVL